MEAAEVVDVVVVEEDVKEVAVEEAEAEEEFTSHIHYIIHMLMELSFPKLRYIIEVSINHYPQINKIQFKKSKLRLVGSIYIFRLMDMF